MLPGEYLGRSSLFCNFKDLRFFCNISFCPIGLWAEIVMYNLLGTVFSLLVREVLELYTKEYGKANL